MRDTHRSNARASALREFLRHEASGGIVLMVAAVAAIAIANSPLAPVYFSALRTYIGPLSLLHWINDTLMALFFLLVGLEIKREMLLGQLSTWRRRALPGAAAVGGMIVPGLIFVAFNYADQTTLRGWAIPAATDIAFALGVLALLGSRIPGSLKVFLAALAVIDDFGAVMIIAVFYTEQINVFALLGAFAVFGMLRALNTFDYQRLGPYLGLGLLLWVLVLLSGVHATVAGVLLALTIPLGKPGENGHDASPLLRLEHRLQMPVAFFVVPIFGFANAGVSLAAMNTTVLLDTLTLGVALGLLVGKLIGVVGAVAIMERRGWADLPPNATWPQLVGVAFLCGIGFTMSLFIGTLAFDDADLQVRVKFGILIGSLLAGFLGYITLQAARAADR